MPSIVNAKTVPKAVDLAKVLDERTFALHQGVRTALMALPAGFSFPHPISGVNATDLFNLNALIGAAIEDQVVATLNRSRTLWDPNHQWDDCLFVRYSQSFPDVRLVRREREAVQVVMGIELKGWFVLSKEREPSLRYQVAPGACADADLVCVVPWYLDNAVCGEAKVLTPWIEQARYAALWRDYWWENVRDSKDDEEMRKIVQPSSRVGPYPSKADLAHAVPVHDGGGNFGRLPRCKPLMDAFVQDTLDEDILGIPVRGWVDFLSLYKDNADPNVIMERLSRKVRARNERMCEEEAEELLALLRKLANNFDFGG